MRFKALLSHLSLALIMATIAGCGIKPSTLTPPPPAKKSDFPRTYPDPSTDPKPQPATQPESSPAP